MSDNQDFRPRNPNLLAAIEHFESGGRNVLNYRYNEDPNYYTASGHYQITNSTWKDGAKMAGVDTDKYPTAISAPYEVQTKVADALLDKYGTKPWEMNAPLMSYLGHPVQQQARGPRFMIASAQSQEPNMSFIDALKAEMPNSLSAMGQMPQLTSEQLQFAQFQRIQNLLRGMQVQAPQITWPGITQNA